MCRNSLASSFHRLTSVVVLIVYFFDVMFQYEFSRRVVHVSISRFPLCLFVTLMCRFDRFENYIENFDELLLHNFGNKILTMLT